MLGLQVPGPPLLDEILEPYGDWFRLDSDGAIGLKFTRAFARKVSGMHMVIHAKLGVAEDFLAAACLRFKDVRQTLFVLICSMSLNLVSDRLHPGFAQWPTLQWVSLTLPFVKVFTIPS